VNLPKDISDLVEGVFGLDNRRMLRRASVQTEATPLTPLRVAELYNFPMYKESSAIGQTIGILEFPDFPGAGGGGFVVDANNNPTDVNGFLQSFGLNPLSGSGPNQTIFSIPLDGAENSPGGNGNPVDLETAADIEVASSVAQGAVIAVYFAPYSEMGWISALTHAIVPGPGEPAPSVISISYGSTEWGELETDTYGPLTSEDFAWTQQAISVGSTFFQQAAVLGITVLVASGDNGSDWNMNDGFAHVIYPASDPWVISCGGTIIANQNEVPFTEGTWNDSEYAGPLFPGVTGGGISEIFNAPALQCPWQSGAGVPPSGNPGNPQGRGIPDVAGNASAYSGYMIAVDGGTLAQPPGGTSVVAPLYAALIALINGAIGTGVGYLNPTLYALGIGGAPVFRDVADGVTNENFLDSYAPFYTSTQIGRASCRERV
jgi:kumamolisin